MLFAGAVRATPDEINNEVIRIVDTMFVEITKCHNMVKPIAVLFDGFATLYEGAVPDEIKLLIGSVTWQEYLLGKAQSLAVDKVADIIGKDIADPITKTAKAVEVVKTFYDSWIKYSQKDRRMLLCINKARANWRSPLQIALMACNFTQKELRLLVLPFLDISSWIKRKYISPMVLGYFL